MKKTGIELIAQERSEQIEKHGRTIKSDVDNNSAFQLAKGAAALLRPSINAKPIGWDNKTWERMCSKPYKERMIIAGALIAAEIDRILEKE